MRLLKFNDLREVHYVEPFAGGASLALALLFEEYASVIHINDLSRPVYAFWYSVLNNADELCRRIENVEVTIAEWYLQRSIYDRRDEADLEDLGFATFFLNRTNRSGIIGGGVIGGKGQNGKWSLDARFTKRELIQRIRRISRYKGRIKLYNYDGIQFTRDVVSDLGGNTFVFFDPPYIEKGQDLYLNDYRVLDHRRLEEQVTQLEQSWVVTYDYEGAVRHQLYRTYPRLAFELSYSTQLRQMGKEALFLSKNLRLPRGCRQMKDLMVI
jgi:DNA adenine methylase